VERGKGGGECCQTTKRVKISQGAGSRRKGERGNLAKSQSAAAGLRQHGEKIDSGITGLERGTLANEKDKGRRGGANGDTRQIRKRTHVVLLSAHWKVRLSSRENPRSSPLNSRQATQTAAHMGQTKKKDAMIVRGVAGSLKPVEPYGVNSCRGEIAGVSNVREVNISGQPLGRTPLPDLMHVGNRIGRPGGVTGERGQRKAGTSMVCCGHAA